MTASHARTINACDRSEPCRQGDINELIRVRRIFTGQDSDGQPLPAFGAFGGGFHHSSESAAHEYRAVARNFRANFKSQRVFFR
jgi:hypothetical protein